MPAAKQRGAAPAANGHKAPSPSASPSPSPSAAAPKKLTLDALVPLLRVACSNADDEVLEYMAGMLLHEYEGNAASLASAVHLGVLLNDLFISYDLAADHRAAQKLSEALFHALVDAGFLQAASVAPAANSKASKLPSSVTSSSTSSSSAAALNKSSLSADGDEWQLPNGAASASLLKKATVHDDAISSFNRHEDEELNQIVYKQVWRPVFEHQRALLLPGIAVQARYTDGRFYDAIIDRIHVTSAPSSSSSSSAAASSSSSSEESNVAGENYLVRFVDYNNEKLVVGLERLKIQERIAIAKITLELEAARALDAHVVDADPFEAAFAVKKFDAPRGIQLFGEKKKKTKSVIVEERKEISKRQLKKEAKMRRLAELTAKRERLRIERATRLQQRALEKYLASDKSIKVGDIEIDHFSMSTPDGAQELLTNSRLKLVQGRRYALIGRNGAGKTSLLRMIANYELDGFPENVRVVHVEQEVAGTNESVIETVMRSDAERESLLREEQELLGLLGEDEVKVVREAALKTQESRKELARAERASRAVAASAADANEEFKEAEEELNVTSMMDEMKAIEDDLAASEAQGDHEENDDDDEDEDKDLDDEADVDDEPVDDSKEQEQSRKPAASSSSTGSRRAGAGTTSRAKYDPPALKEVVPPHIRYQQVMTRLLDIDAYGAEARARAILNGLAFSNSRQSQLTKDLSGGWRMRTAIACALFVAPDLLLLDEPTNHLDFPSVIWLENYLNNYEKTLVIVSHDRSFLDAVATDVVHLYQRNLHYYRGDYTAFEKIRKAKLLQMKREFEAQQLKRAHIESFIAKFRYNASRAALVQSRIKALQRMDALVEVVEDQEVRFSFPQPDPIAGTLIGIQDMSFGYIKGKTLLNKVNMTVDMNSRIAILGANGVGKSTLLHLMLGRFPPVSGSITRSSAVRISTFTQHHIDTLDLHLSPVDAMGKLFPGHPEEHFRRHLGGFGVTGTLATQEISSLSGGQKSRVAFAVVTWRKPHLIVFDEPTNHLDLETIEALIAAIKAFEGGVVVVSHDEHFLTNVANEFYGVGNGKVSRFETYSESKKHTYAASTT